MDSSFNPRVRTTYDEEGDAIFVPRIPPIENPSEIDIKVDRERQQVEYQEALSRRRKRQEASSKAREKEEALLKIRKELEEKTGFATYKAYLKSLCCDPMYAGRSYIDILRTCWGDRAENRWGPRDYGSPGVDIIDVSDEDHSFVGVSLRCQNLSASEISAALCHPPPNTRAQVVLWPIEHHLSPHVEDFLDVLGVGLELDPIFFETLRWREEESFVTETFRSKLGLRIDSIGTSVFVARSFVLAQHVPVPVVLIAGPMYHRLTFFNGTQRANDPTSINRAFYDLVQAAPLYSHYNDDGQPHLANAYTRALFSLLKSSGGSALSPTDTLSACIIPLLQIEIAICRCSLGQLRELFYGMFGSMSDHDEFTTKYWGYHGQGSRARLLDDGATESLYHHRTKLRSWVEYFENEKSALIGFLYSLYGPDSTGRVFNSQIIEGRTSIIEEVRRLEAEIRDHLQLQSSKLALEESKNSIELSNRQIYESKRVKIFTVLAFFYIPLNLATSIFGMNLQQLNGSGTSIGAFLGTAATLLFISGMTWLVFQGVQDALMLVRQSEEEKRSVSCRNPSIFLRFGLIWLLCRNGLSLWMIRTGAGWYLLTNSSKGFFSKNKSFSHKNGVTASQFVMWIAPHIGSRRPALNADKGGWLSRHKEHRDPYPAGS